MPSNGVRRRDSSPGTASRTFITSSSHGKALQPRKHFCSTSCGSCFAALPRSRSPTYDSPPATVAAVPRRVDRAHLRVRAHELVVRAGCGSRRTGPVPVAGRRAVPAVHADRQRRRPLTRRSSGTRSISGRTMWSGIAAMTRRAFGGVSGFVTSCLCWSCAAPRMGVASVGGGGCWSAPSPGSVSFGACGCGMTSEPTSTRPSSRSGARSFAGSRCAKRGRPREAGARNRTGVVKAPVQRRPCGKQGRRTTHSNSSRMCERPAFTAMRSVAASGDIYLLTGVKRSALRKQLYLVAAHEGDGVSGL